MHTQAHSEVTDIYGIEYGDTENAIELEYIKLRHSFFKTKHSGHTRILEIGCGGGFFYRCPSKGLEKYFGLEPCPVAYKKLTELTPPCADSSLCNIQLENLDEHFDFNQFDCVVFFASAYYVNLFEFLERLYIRKSYKGAVFFCTPNIELRGFVPHEEARYYHNVREYAYFLKNLNLQYSLTSVIQHGILRDLRSNRLFLFVRDFLRANLQRLGIQSDAIFRALKSELARRDVTKNHNSATLRLLPGYAESATVFYFYVNI
jgi:SAM-dependent methyltransferase